MRSFFILFIFLTLTLEASAVNKLKQGESYSGTLTKLYINSNAVALPPGLWKVTERDTERGHWEFESATLKHKDGSEIYLRLSKSRDNQIRWLGNIGWFDGCSWGTVWAKGKGQVHHASKGKSYWCVIKDGSWDYRTSGSIKAVDTAKSRNLSLENCSKLTGRKNSMATEEEKEESTIEQKLQKLKKLLSDGLISQEDYDKKKDEYLKDY